MDYRAILRTQSQIGVAAANNAAARARRAVTAARAVTDVGAIHPSE
jgi:hypothetical protein